MDTTQNTPAAMPDTTAIPIDPSVYSPNGTPAGALSAPQGGASVVDQAKHAFRETIPDTHGTLHDSAVLNDISDLMHGKRTWEQVRTQAAQRNSLGFTAANSGSSVNQILAENINSPVEKAVQSVVPFNLAPQWANPNEGLGPREPVTDAELHSLFHYKDAEGHDQEIPVEMQDHILDGNNVANRLARQQIVVQQLLPNQQRMAQQMADHPVAAIGANLVAGAGDLEQLPLTVIPGGLAAKASVKLAKGIRMGLVAAADAGGALAADMRSADHHGEAYNYERGAQSLTVGAVLGMVHGGLLKSQEGEDLIKSIEATAETSRALTVVPGKTVEAPKAAPAGLLGAPTMDVLDPLAKPAAPALSWDNVIDGTDLVREIKQPGTAVQPTTLWETVPPARTPSRYHARVTWDNTIDGADLVKRPYDLNAETGDMFGGKPEMTSVQDVADRISQATGESFVSAETNPAVVGKATFKNGLDYAAYKLGENIDQGLAASKMKLSEVDMPGNAKFNQELPPVTKALVNTIRDHLPGLSDADVFAYAKEAYQTVKGLKKKADVDGIFKPYTEKTFKPDVHQEVTPAVAPEVSPEAAAHHEAVAKTVQAMADDHGFSVETPKADHNGDFEIPEEAPPVAEVKTPQDAYNNYSAVVERVAAKEAGPIEKGTEEYADIIDQLHEKSGIDWNKAELSVHDYETAMAKLEAHEAESDLKAKQYAEELKKDNSSGTRTMDDHVAAKVPDNEGLPVVRTTSVPTPKWFSQAHQSINGKKLNFASPVDRALFIVGKDNSKHVEKALDYLELVYGDKSRDELRAIAQEVYHTRVTNEATLAGDHATSTYISRTWDQYATPRDVAKVDGRLRGVKEQNALTAAIEHERLVKDPVALDNLDREITGMDNELERLAEVIGMTTGKERLTAKKVFTALENKVNEMRERYIDAFTSDTRSAETRVKTAQAQLEVAEGRAKVMAEEVAPKLEEMGIDPEAADELGGFHDPRTILTEQDLLDHLKAAKELDEHIAFAGEEGITEGLSDATKAKLAVGAGLVGAAGAAEAKTKNKDDGWSVFKTLGTIGLIAAGTLAFKGRFKWANIKGITKDLAEKTGESFGNYHGRAREATNIAFKTIVKSLGADHLGGKSGVIQFREMAARNMRIPFENSFKTAYGKWLKGPGKNAKGSWSTGSRFQKFDEEVTDLRRNRGIHPTGGTYDQSVIDASKAVTKMHKDALDVLKQRHDYWVSKGWPTDDSLLGEWAKIQHDEYYVPRLMNYENIRIMQSAIGRSGIVDIIHNALKDANPGAGTDWLERTSEMYMSTIEAMGAGSRYKVGNNNVLGQIQKILTDKGFAPDDIEMVAQSLGIESKEVGIPSRTKARININENYRDPNTGFGFSDLLNNSTIATSDNWMNQAASAIGLADATIHNPLFIDGAMVDLTHRCAYGNLKQAIISDGRGGLAGEKFASHISDFDDLWNHITGRHVGDGEGGNLDKTLATLHQVGRTAMMGRAMWSVMADMAGTARLGNMRNFFRTMPGLRSLMLGAAGRKLDKLYMEDIRMFGGFGDFVTSLPVYAMEEGAASLAQAVTKNVENFANKYRLFTGINKGQHLWALRQVHQRFVDAAFGKIRVTPAGVLSGKDVSWATHLENMGIPKADLAQILPMVKKYAKVDGDGMLQRLNLREMMLHHPQEATLFNTSAMRWVMKYGSESFFDQTFPWAHRMIGKIIGQLNSSTFAAQFHTLHYGVANFDREILQNWVAGAVGGVAGYVGSTYNAYYFDKKELKKRMAWSELGKAAFYRAQMSGILPKLISASMQLTGGKDPFNAQTNRGMDVGVVAGQAVQLGSATMGALGGLARGKKLDQGTAKLLEQMSLTSGVVTAPIVGAFNQTLPKNQRSKKH